MKGPLRIYWIDDDARRIRSAKNIERKINAKVKFIDVTQKGKDGILEKIQNEIQKAKPDLILVDHKFDKVKGFSTGSTLAELIRETLSDRPILGVTGVDIDTEINYSKRSVYEDVLDINQMSQNYVTINGIAQAYRKLRANPPTNEGDLLKLLKAPKEEKQKLAKILPTDLKKNFNDKSLLPRISKWVRKTLLAYPGFLYDQLWVPTLVGVRVTSFAKITTMFDSARYTGLFADESEPKWWLAKIREILHKKVKSDDFIPLNEYGSRLKKIGKRDISICHVCRKPKPDIVAYVDETNQELEPMHLRCTVPHPGFSQMLFFEEIRLMKGED